MHQRQSDNPQARVTADHSRLADTKPNVGTEQTASEMGASQTRSAPSTDVSMPVISVLSMSERSEPRVSRGPALAAGDADAPAPTMRGGACRSALAF